MIFAAIFGVMILAVVIYVSMRILGNVVYGAVIIALILVASYLIIGSFPDLRQVPLVGAFVPDIGGNLTSAPTTGDVINVLRNVLYNLKIIDIERSSTGNALVTVVNAGRLDLHGFRVFMDDQEVRVINAPKSPLVSGDSTVIETNWAKPYSKVVVWTLETSAQSPA